MTQLILLPGLAANETMWQAQAAVLSARWATRITDVHSRYDSIPAMASALLAETPGPLVLCGASMGGMIAMEVARQAPERVQGLALLGTTARPETPDMRALREAAIVAFEQGRVRDIIEPNIGLAFHPEQASNKALAQAYLDFVLAAGADQLIAQNRAVIARPDARPHLANTRCPVLVLCGDSDQLTPPECSHEIAALAPDAQLHLLARCGHMLTMERPEEVNALLLAWLQPLLS